MSATSATAWSGNDANCVCNANVEKTSKITHEEISKSFNIQKSLDDIKYVFFQTKRSIYPENFPKAASEASGAPPSIHPGKTQTPKSILKLVPTCSVV